MVKNAQQPQPETTAEAAPEAVPVYDCLRDLLIAQGEPTGNQRVYRVRLPDVGDSKDECRYVVSNSKANAAHAVCEVETVSMTERLDAARAVVNGVKGIGVPVPDGGIPTA